MGVVGRIVKGLFWLVVTLFVLGIGVAGIQEFLSETPTEETSYAVAYEGCEAAILSELRNPASATIEPVSSNGEASLFKVRAQNGFGGLNVEQWACTQGSEGKLAFPWNG